MPVGPVYTSMTLGLEGSIVIMRSALSATSAGLSTIWKTCNRRVREEQFIMRRWCNWSRPTWAPSSCTSLQDSGKTSVAMTGYPCFSKFFAIGFPIFPRPTKPTCVFEAMDLLETTNSSQMSSHNIFAGTNDSNLFTVKLLLMWLCQIILYTFIKKENPAQLGCLKINGGHADV